jgi:recombination protein RecR
MAQSDIENLIKMFAKLPGLGPRSARRAVLHLLKHRESIMQPLTSLMTQTAASVVTCADCGNLDTESPCHICADETRDRSLLCVVEEVADLWAFERGGIYKGIYHVLGGTLSALDGVGPEDLGIPRLMQRAAGTGLKEVIIATNATVDGQTTAHYISQRLKDAGIQTTRLAHGLPIGGELDYMDEGTLSAALSARQSV